MKILLPQFFSNNKSVDTHDNIFCTTQPSFSIYELCMLHKNNNFSERCMVQSNYKLEFKYVYEYYYFFMKNPQLFSSFFDGKINLRFINEIPTVQSFAKRLFKEDYEYYKEIMWSPWNSCKHLHTEGSLYSPYCCHHKKCLYNNDEACDHHECPKNTERRRFKKDIFYETRSCNHLHNDGDVFLICKHNECKVIEGPLCDHPECR